MLRSSQAKATFLPIPHGFGVRDALAYPPSDKAPRANLALFAALSLFLLLFALALVPFESAFAQAPESISGVAHVVCTNPGGAADTFQITMPDGSTVTGHCLDHGLPAPADGSYSFTGTWNGSSYNIVMSTQGASILPGQIDIGSGCQRIGSFTWTPVGRISIAKESADPALTEGNALYPIQGATYSIYSDKSCTNSVGELDLESSDTAASDYLIAGTYWVKETKAPARYALDPTVYQVEVSAKQATPVNDETVKDIPLTTELEVLAYKRDTETSQSCPLGSASLAGAEFTIRYYDGIYDSAKAAEASGKPTKTWIVKTDSKGVAKARESYRVSGDAFYTDSAGNTCLPAGTLLVQETKAPEGYLLGDQPVAVVSITQKGSSLCAYNAPVVADQVVRGDLEFVKTSSTTQQRLAGVPFRITSTTTGESHILLTDQNGRLSTASSFNPHTAKTNGNDTASNGAYSQDCGIWFGIDSADGMTAPNDKLGALPFDTYRIEELSCSANKGLQLVKCSVVISKNKTVVDFGTIDDPESSISTSAHDGEDSDKNIVREEQATIVDTVAYAGLIPGREYQLEGSLVDASTGEAVSAKGKPIVASTTFTPTSSSGNVQLSFEFDSRLVGARKLVVFEKLLCDNRAVATHADVNDEGQSIYLLEPSIGTTCTEEASASHTASCRSSVTLVDKIAFTNLSTKSEYVVSGRLMDAETGEPLLSQGEEVSASASFVPESPSGEVTVSYTFDSSALDGKRAVAFEELSCNGQVIAEHKDLESEEQTVEFSATTMNTSAIDYLDGDKSVVADKEASITDRIGYVNAQPGQNYLLVGILVDAKTGLPLASGPQTDAPSAQERTAFLDKLEAALGKSGDAKQLKAPAQVDAQALQELLSEDNDTSKRFVMATSEFSAESATGAVEQTFVFDASELGNTQAVVYEALIADDELLFAENDPENEDQQVRITPSSIATEALDTSDEDHKVTPDAQASITDNVFYTDLIPGKEYIVKGTLMNKQTGKPQQVDGKPITSQLRFTPNEPSGSVELEFVFDASALNGTTLVVFEDLYKDSVLVAAHADINDKAQSVEVGPGTTPTPTPGKQELLDKTGATLAGLLIAALALMATGGGLYAASVAYERAQKKAAKTKR